MILEQKSDTKISGLTNFPPPNSRTSPEIALAMFIVGCLASQGIITVSLDVEREGFDDVEMATKMIAQILTENHVITNDEFWIRRPYTTEQS